MAQAGRENEVDAKESGRITGHGLVGETPRKKETVIFGDGRLFEETTVNRQETVVITNE